MTLPKRVRDVLTRRFGIHGKDRETLEAIGQRYGITRERIRQIEAAGLDTLKDLVGQDALKRYVDMLHEHVTAHGGVMEQDHLLTSFQREQLGQAQPEPSLSGSVLLLLSVSDKFDRRRGSQDFYPHWYVHADHVRNMETVLKALHGHFTKNPRTLKLNEMVTLMAEQQLSFTPTSIETYVEVSRHMGQNPYGEFGLIHWPEVRPKGVRDKAYLVLKNHGKPLHFLEVTRLINEQGFSPRRALAQTVHNELIKDKRFVLVGRGIYGLSQWGYKPGTVRDVIVEVMKAEPGPMAREAIVQKVLKHRFVKPNTIVLNLHNRKEFVKMPDGRYRLRV